MKYKYETISVKDSVGGITITLNRPEHRNTLNATLLKEINDVLSLVKQDSNCQLVLLEGQQGFFCTGMDFNEISESQMNVQQKTQHNEHDEDLKKTYVSAYMETIKQFTLIPKIIVSLIDGRVTAGGVGLAAASDLVIATPRSQFSLSEALWGLLPAMVTPYLIRRVGFQVAYRMTLTTRPVSAEEAYENHLVDEISESPYDSAHRWWLRLSRLEESTVKNIKQFFRKMWLITRHMEEIAVSETTRLTSDPKVLDNIVNYVKYQKFPWDNREINKPG